MVTLLRVDMSSGAMVRIPEAIHLEIIRPTDIHHMVATMVAILHQGTRRMDMTMGILVDLLTAPQAILHEGAMGPEKEAVVIVTAIVILQVQVLAGVAATMSQRGRVTAASAVESHVDTDTRAAQNHVVINVAAAAAAARFESENAAPLDVGSVMAAFDLWPLHPGCG